MRAENSNENTSSNHAVSKIEKAGILLLDKKPGLTSFETLNQVKKTFSTPKVGHTGTLDKFASGLLVVLVGRAVKLVPWFESCDKRYEGIIRFGEETATLDPEGEVIARAPVPGRERLEEALSRFRGDILQAPPLYSAIHLDGVRAHELARRGVQVVMEKRPVSIFNLELVSYEPPLAEINVHCSKGAYIRSLARDIALEAGSRGHLASLKRTRVAGFTLEDASNFELKPISPEVFNALGLPVLEADDEAVGALIRGKPIDPLFNRGKIGFRGNSPAPEWTGGQKKQAAGVFDTQGGFVAVIQKNDSWKYGYVYAHT
ncbi:MAG: tRNA pseudouridine(55) synthase TruB [Treponema sp.]|jgi:tRNA pseudouridine55 synthase|nr:tRNA pseudouridine(55) synthase TruB [Treponema sp.]